MNKRIVNNTEARNYLGISRTLFEKLQKQGVIPQPLPGTKRYDIKAIDKALDRIALSGGTHIDDPDEQAASYERWKAEQMGR